MSRVIVVGAGIAGLACARALRDAGADVLVLERSRVPGGRLASKTYAGRRADIGAAYFTVDDDGFAAVVAGWRERGLVRDWTDTLTVFDPSGRHTTTGPVRLAAPGGLRSLAEDLADGLDVHYGHTVSTVEPGLVDGEACDAVVLAMPGPQAARLLGGSAVAGVRAVAEAQEYRPVLAVTIGLPRRTWHPFAAAFVNDHPVLSLVADDGDRRGDGAAVLVAHSTHEVAAAHLADPAAAVPGIVTAVRDLLELPDAPDYAEVHRWSFATPAGPGDRPFHCGPERVALAGDAWGRPRVQTAWLSGTTLATHLHTP